MITVGVDLAAQPERTAVAVLDWSGGTPAVAELLVGADDAAVVALVAESDRAGIDAPFGWPDAFVDLVAHHHLGPADRGGQPGTAGLGTTEARQPLVLRRTDLRVRALTGLTPLSVSADRIAHVALRCAGLLGTLAARGVDVRRDGTGPMVEVYPAGSLRLWGLPTRGYKGAKGATARAGLAELLAAALPIPPGLALDRCVASDHALDAVVSAMTARAAALGRWHRPDADERAPARREGWIVLPDLPVAALRDAAPAVSPTSAAR